MPEQQTDIRNFTTRVRQMILKFTELKNENAELYSMVDERDQQIAELKKQLENRKREYDDLLAAKVFNIDDESLEATKKRLSSLIRNVNNCITLLSEHDSE